MIRNESFSKQDKHNCHFAGFISVSHQVKILMKVNWWRSSKTWNKKNWTVNSSESISVHTSCLKCQLVILSSQSLPIKIKNVRIHTRELNVNQLVIEISMFFLIHSQSYRRWRRHEKSFGLGKLNGRWYVSQLIHTQFSCESRILRTNQQCYIDCNLFIYNDNN